MPSVITHYLLACRLEKYIAEDFPRLSINTDAFFWGAQGADFFSSHKSKGMVKDENLRELSNMIHSKNSEEALDFICNLANNRRNPIALSYAMGYISHVVLDDMAEPFISYGVSRLENTVPRATKESCRCLIKSNLDVVMLRSERSALPNEFKLWKAVPKNPEVMKYIAEMYRSMIKDVYGRVAGKNQIMTAENDFIKEQKKLYDPVGIKIYIAKQLEKFFRKPPEKSSRIRPLTEESDIDYANILNCEWTDLKNKTQTKSFINIFDEAELYAKKLIYALVSGEKISTFL